MEGLRTDQEFEEFLTPRAIQNILFKQATFQELLRTVKEDPSRCISPDHLAGITIDHVREWVARGTLSNISGKNLFYPIRPKDYAPTLRSFARFNQGALAEVPLNPENLKHREKTGIRKEFSIPLSQEKDYPAVHLLNLLMMSFYRRVQATLIEDLGRRNFVIGADEVIKKDILRASIPDGIVVKFSGNPNKRREPLIVPPHHHLIDTRIFPIKRNKGEDGIIVINEDISGAKRLDKFKDDELPLEERLGGVVDSMKGCVHLHNEDLVYHDIKPGNIFYLEISGLLPHWILADTEALMKHGEKYSHDDLGPILYGTLDYLDACYYAYSSNMNSKADKAIDVFAYAITILEQYLGDKFDEFQVLLKQKAADNIDIDLIEALKQQVGSKTPIPFVILDLLGRMLKYDRYSRPGIKEVFEVLTKHL